MYTSKTCAVIINFLEASNSKLIPQVCDYKPEEYTCPQGTVIHQTVIHSGNTPYTHVIGIGKPVVFIVQIQSAAALVKVQ